MNFSKPPSIDNRKKIRLIKIKARKKKTTKQNNRKNQIKSVKYLGTFPLSVSHRGVMYLIIVSTKNQYF